VRFDINGINSKNSFSQSVFIVGSYDPVCKVGYSLKQYRRSVLMIFMYH
jgi:hypothetical protein